MNTRSHVITGRVNMSLEISSRDNSFVQSGLQDFEWVSRSKAIVEMIIGNNHLEIVRCRHPNYIVAHFSIQTFKDNYQALT